jgi:hypothetical protein
MRTSLILIALGIGVALVAIVLSVPTSADQVVGPGTRTTALASSVDGAGQGAMILLVKGGQKNMGNNNGSHDKWRYHRYDRWYGYPDSSWDSDSYDSGYQNCVWNGYSYTCFRKSYSY